VYILYYLRHVKARYSETTETVCYGQSMYGAI